MKPIHAVLVAAGCIATPGSFAADYPDRPIRIIVPSAPGGGTDTTMRIISPKLGEVLGQRIVLENRPGQSGNIGVEAASRAAPDGYTLAAMIASNASNPAVMKSVPYNLERDFAAVSLAAVMPNVLTVHPSLPVRTIKDLVALGKSKRELQYASPGFGSTAHLAMELLMSMAGFRMQHVPYKSGGAAFISVQSGEMLMMFGNVMSSLQHVRSGRVRALGVTSLKRSTAAPEIPAIAEFYPGYEASTWYGVLAPAGTPREIVAKLHKAMVATAHDPATAKLFSDGGAAAAASASPEEFAAYISAEMKKWAKLVKDAGIKPE
ncbi:MAG TPA: tripartite tricarboxylate transporter substrate binding protein [Burkholderiales bacterium]|nr:tripartite tricarboxylate transporter substrate binding protein [Burkholderiales bacterium]